VGLRQASCERLGEFVGRELYGGRMVMQQMVNIIRLAGWDAYLNSQLDEGSVFQE
jgi:hypothetical protein